MDKKISFSQEGQRRQFDLLVIGGGIAGLTYILEVLKINSHCKIALITKKEIVECNSNHAQGGIAAAVANDDSIEKHMQDTIVAGDGLSDPAAVKEILSYGSQCIETLISHHVKFDRSKLQYDLAQEGGHSERRIYHAGDHTGEAIITALVKAVEQHTQVEVLEYHTVVNLISEQQEVVGAYVLDEKSHKIDTYLSSVVVLATGGAGKVYRYTSNLDVATGDGIAMSYRIGAKVANLEFYQFHPTLLYHHKINNFLITEALRGEGAYLLDSEKQERFMQKYAPEKMELATRDIVARAIFNEIERSERKYVYLDVRHKSREYLQTRFPKIFQTLLKIGIDISTDLIPVVPAAHYLCGGVVTHVNGFTSVDRLYAIGETACTGLHGANRLASNSLLEGVVMAHFAAEDSMRWLNNPVSSAIKVKAWCSECVTDLRRASQINAHWRGLREEMTAYAGIIRTEAGLKDLHKLVLTRCEMIENYYWQHEVTRDLIELRNIILVAELIVRSALQRKESRGGHYREDYPEKFTKPQNTILQMDDVDLL